MGLCQYLITVAIVCCANVIYGQNKFAEQVRQCHDKDPSKFDQCALQFWQDIRPQLKKGIPELNVPQMDPMTISNLDFSEQGAIVNINAKFSEIKVVGVGEYTPKSVTVDPKARVIKVTLFIPALYIKGRYDIDGTVLLFPVKGNGPFTLNLTSIDGIATIHMVPTANGASASQLEIDFNIQNIGVELTGLSGGETIGAAINKMLNDNSQQILADIKPQVAQRLGEGMQKIVANAFVDMPREAFIA
ncbi:hypothetical protein CHUAL_013149 [Chamberlinius hualienensis]